MNADISLLSVGTSGINSKFAFFASAKCKTEKSNTNTNTSMVVFVINLR